MTENPATDTAQAAQEPAQEPDSTAPASTPDQPSSEPQDGIQAPADEVALLNDDPTAAMPYTGEDIQQDSTWVQQLSLPLAPRTRTEQFRFLRAAVAGPHTWHNECLNLARSAPGIPAGVPSAHAAALMVLPGDKVGQVSNLRRGMVIFYSIPDNPFWHVTTVCGWLTPAPTDSLHDVLTVGSDVPVDDGEVGYVRADYFLTGWHATWEFGSRTLNGYRLPGYGTNPTPGPTVVQTLDMAIAAIRRGIVVQRRRGHTPRVNALVKELHELLAQRAHFAR